MLYKLVPFFILFRLADSLCPNLCASCKSDNITCLSCIAPHTYIPSSSTCQYCNTNCTSCAQDGSCLGCITGLQPLRNNDGTISCVPQCRIANCATCGTTASGAIVCQTCAAGFFYSITYNACFACKSPCNVCTPDTNTYANKIYPYWRSRIQNLFQNSSSFISPNGTIVQLPTYLVNIQNQNTYDITIAPYWSQAYYLYFGFLPLIPVTVNFTYIVLTAINTIPLLTNKTVQQTNAYLLNIVNQILLLNYTIDQYMNKIGAAVAALVPCSICNTGFGMNITNSSNTFCQSCNTNVQGCAKCTTLSYCDQCIDGTYSANSPITTCTLCSSNCATCATTSTNCLTCYPPYSLSNTSPYKSCILCSQPCLTCTSLNTSSCITCKPPYSKYANSTGYCYRCFQDTCSICDSNNNSICTACKVGYILNSTDNTCSSCSNNCDVCNNGTCYQCASNYVLNNNGVCVACGPNCISCSSANVSVCYNCRNGSYYQLSNSTCTPCMDACLTCNSSTTCLTNKDGVVVYNNVAVSCRPGCQTCNPLNPQLCTQCLDRFILINNICKPCPNGCSICSSTTVCTTCADNLNLVSGNCVPCLGNCRTCSPTNLTQCLTCIVGTNLVNNICVRGCKNGCQQCSDSNSSICLICSNGYALKLDGNCIKCTKTCNGRCDPKNINLCLSCIDGYYLSNNICNTCPFGCINCNNNQCNNCTVGYTLSTNSYGNSICIQSCNYPCISCNNNICNTCDNGYLLISNLCYPDISCNPNCQFCPLATYNSATLPTITCVRCVDFCATCPANICTNCIDGYYLSNASCIRCPSQCQSCYDSQNCKLCSSGYTKQLLSIGNDITSAVFNNSCIVCDSNCLTCDVLPTRCTTCASTMYLIGFRCVNLYTVNFNYHIDYNYTSFIQNGESDNFITVLASTAGVSINDTYITSVTEGSTVIAGTMSSTGQSNAVYIQSTLTNNINGYSVITSSSTVYYGDQPQYAQTPAATVNIGLIAGATVGGTVGLLLIIFIIYKLVKMKKKKIVRQRVKVQNVDSSSLEKSQQDINYYAGNDGYASRYQDNYGNRQSSYVNNSYNRQQTYINSINSINRDDSFNKSQQTFISKIKKSKAQKIKARNAKKSKK